MDSPQSPTPLTPRSKVRAMLAALDEDASDGGTARIQVTGASSTNSLDPGELQARDGILQDYQRRLPVAEDIDEGEDDEEPVSRPRGRMASRMQMDKSLLVSESKENNGQATEKAYERIKRQLMGTKQPVVVTGTAMHAPESRPDARGDDDALLVKATRNGPGSKSDVRVQHRLGSVTRPSRGISPIAPVSSENPTREESASPHQEDSDSDLPDDPHSNSRFLALVERKRQERLVKEAEVARKQNEKKAQQERLAKARRPAKNINVSDSDSANDKRLTQHARPVRKASKKALEEMHRETQRMSRNMHLAHKPRTRKKITKQSFLDLFNYKPASSESEKIETSGTGPRPSSNVVSEADVPYSTAPSSPPAIDDVPHRSENRIRTLESGPSVEAKTLPPCDDEELPSFDEVMSCREPTNSGSNTSPGATSLDVQAALDHRAKGKSKAIEVGSLDQRAGVRGCKEVLRRIRVRQPILSNRPSDSGSDLEVIPTSKAKVALFEHVHHGKETQSRPLLVQRTLARINIQGERPNKNKASITPAELQSSLRQRARQQAVKEREDRLQDLRDRGIILQTAEERAKDNATIEELIEKARKETEEMAKKDKAAAKKAGEKHVGADLFDDDSDDEEWDEEEDELELSGSEEGEERVEGDDDKGLEEEGEEDHVDETDVGQMATTVPAGKLTHDALEQDKPSLISVNQEAVTMNHHLLENHDGDDDGDSDSPPQPQRRDRKTRARVLSDDDEDMAASSTAEERAPVSAKKLPIPGLPISEGISMGLTQIFAGTMADSQTQQFGSATNLASQGLDQHSLDFMRQIPAMSLPHLEQSLDQASQELIKDSQPLLSQASLAQDYVQAEGGIDDSQPDVQGPFDALYSSATQVSEFPDPTQDVGFASFGPIGGRFVQSLASTVDTLMMDRDQTPTATTPVKKRGRLRRRIEVSSSEEDDAVDADVEDEVDVSANVYDIMRKAATKPSYDEQFDKKKSEAKQMVEEQAEESEDEYAGLGGASEDDSANDEDEEAMKDMLDDEAQDVDQQDIAALFADKDRADDKRQIEKIYRDVTTGILRKKRGAADLDLSDSDYEEDARRRMKRNKEMRLRKALLVDEHVEKIATNPKKAAFFHSIEDRDKVEEVDFLDGVVESQRSESFIATTGAETDGAIPAVAMHQRKLGPEEVPFNDENEAPPHLRRVEKAKRPHTVAELRECLSTLIAPPNAVVVHDANNEEDAGDSDDEVELSKDTVMANIRVPGKLIDRLSLLRRNATVAGTGTGSSTRLAFQDSATMAGNGIRLPTLLRRATTTSLTSTHFNLVTTDNNKEEIDGTKLVVKRGGNKKSCSINYQSREQERKKAKGLLLADGDRVEKSYSNDGRSSKVLLSRMKQRGGGYQGMGGVLAGKFED